MDKKGLMLSIIIVLGMLLVFSSLVLADRGDDNGNGGSDDGNNDSEDEDENENESEIKIRGVLREGNCTIKIERELKTENGKTVEVVKREMKCTDGTKEEVKIRFENKTESGRYTERIRYEFRGKELEVEAEEGIEFEEEVNGTEYKLKAKLRDGNFTHIKIMPDRASEIALERLKALNFTIELREIEHNNIPRVVYNIESNKDGKFLGVFKLKMKVEGQVDPETGEFIGINKPWWAFLVSGEDSDETESEEKRTINLSELNNSGESGTAMFSQEDGQVIVTLSTIGFTQNISQPAHIHVGSCPDTGAVRYPLNNVLNGESITTINVTFDNLESELPLAINIHKSVEESSVYTICGNLTFD
ncbi:MAG: hypothetical protein NUV46_03955 [Nanoarchaeota archaeon]|nr:hypothetical protein [Nanoarchaeota archaeon]